MTPLVEIQHLTHEYSIRKGIFRKGPTFRALHDVNVSLREGKIHGLIGESGSGKSTLAKILCGLIRPSQGAVRIGGSDLSTLVRSRKDLAKKVQMIFQNPYASIDPLWPVKAVLEEGLHGLPAHERRERILRALDQVVMKPECLSKTAKELSGGERQRIAIARAAAVSPEFLVLDEPTAQLDVTVQKEILVLLKQLQRAVKGMLFITHDLALAGSICDEIIVMKEGRVVETGSAKEIMSDPKHGYTRELAGAVLRWPV